MESLVRSFVVSSLLFLPVLAGSPGAALAAPPDERVSWRADYDAAFEEARERNVPVLVAVIQDGENENERMVRACYSNRDFVRLTEMTVNVIASRGTSEDHGVIEVEVDGRTRRLCEKYGSVACFEHQDLEFAVFRDFSKDGSIDTPYHALVHPLDHRVLGFYDDYIDRASLMSLIKKAQREVGEGLDAEEYERVKAALASAESHLESKEVPAAVEALEEVSRVRADGGIADRVREKLDSIEETGYELLAKGKEAAASGKYPTAFQHLMAVKEGFASFRKLQREANRAERKWKSDPEGRKAAKAIELEPEAKERLESARRFLDGQNYERGLEHLGDLLDRYDGTPSAVRAAELLEALAKSPASRDAVQRFRAERECRRLLGEAEGRRARGKLDEARSIYRKILETCPDSPPAAEAKSRLDELDG